MASTGLGPWFHKKIVDPLLQILRRYFLSLSLSLKRFCLCFISSCFLFVGAGLLGVIESTFGGILLGLCFITHGYRSLIGYYAFPMLRFWPVVCQQALSSGLKQLRDLKNQFSIFFHVWAMRNQTQRKENLILVPIPLDVEISSVKPCSII
jgi:hypothetical protein